MAKKGRSENELEMKISVSREDMEKVFAHFRKLSADGKVSHKYMPRAYYDTDDFALNGDHVSLRVQYKPGKNGKIGGYEQTVKYDLPEKSSKNKDMLDRCECKDALPSHDPDIDAVSSGEAASRLKDIKNGDLKHVFTAAIERRYFQVSLAQEKKATSKGGTVELAFDIGEVILQSNNAHHPFAEIEIELKSGDPAIVEKIKDVIFKLAPSARIETHSKAEQGIALYRDSLSKKK